LQANTYVNGTPDIFSAAGAYSDTRAGWTAGGGVEWMFAPNWSAKVEYLYYDLGSATYALTPLVNANCGSAGACYGSFAQSSVRFDGHIVRGGVNYHFNWGDPAPVVAKY
jgi:outer membrane immunogenic protein